MYEYRTHNHCLQKYLTVCVLLDDEFLCILRGTYSLVKTENKTSLCVQTSGGTLLISIIISTIIIIIIIDTFFFFLLGILIL